MIIKKKKSLLETLKQRLLGYEKYLAILLVLLLVTSLVRNVLKSIEVRKRIKEEQKKVETLRKEKEELERQVAETQSAEYIEKQLRDKLGLAKEGETVLILPEEETLKKLITLPPEEKEVLPDPTWKKWLKLFL